MTDTFRALCAELADELQGYKVAHPMHCRALLTRARAALAQPEPVPTDEEIGEWHDQCADLTRLGEVDHYWAFDLQSDEVAGVVRAALARWGTPTIQPVPVSERLPGADDCDAEGCCWAIGERGNWMDVHVIGRNWSNPIYTHWLPRWALPVPANTTKEEN